MTAPANASSPHEPLRVGLIADDEDGPTVAAALRGAPELELVGLAGAQFESESDAPWFDDRRVMITTTKPQAVVLATAPRAAIDLDEMFLLHDLAVWRKPPIARNFAEAVQLMQRLNQPRPHYRVASWWEHVREPVRDTMQAIEDFQPRFSELSVARQGPSVQSWRAGLIEAGGGVLTLDAYDLLEAFVAQRGLPDNVSSAAGKHRKRPGEAPRETEDVAVAILRFVDGAIALLRASWDLPNESAALRHHGAEGSLDITAQDVSTVDFDGRVLRSAALPHDVLTTELRRFAMDVRQGARAEQEAKTRERHLAVTALLEAVYLAARTWAPESPRKFYEVQGWRGVRG